MTPTIAAIGTALSAIGTGVALYSSNQAANAQEALGIANAQAQGDAARNAAAQQQMALKFQKLQQDAISSANNIQAKSLLQQSEAATNAAQQNIRRERERFQALVAQQYAALGQSGVSPVTGSPIDILMENAAAEQEQEMVLRDEDETRRRRATMEALVLQGNSFSAGVNSQLLSLESAAAGMRGRMGQAQARLDAASSSASARGMRGQALGNALAGGAETAFKAYTFKKDYTTAKPVK